jgi:hydrogenase maturation protease
MEHAPVGGPLVIGVGNRYRRDDGVGLVVAGRLREVACDASFGDPEHGKRTPCPLVVAEASGEGAALLEAFQGAAWVILVDAVASGAVPGTVLRLDAVAEPLPKQLFRYSTHALGVAEAVELARALGRLPARLVIFGVEGAEYAAGEGISPEVERAAGRVVGLILEEASSGDAPPQERGWPRSASDQVAGRQ